MNDSELLEQISNKLTALLALSFIKNPTEMTTADGVRLLLRFGLNNQQVADILGTTKRTVEVMKSRDQKNKK